MSDKRLTAPRTTPVGICPMCGDRDSDKLFTSPDRLHKTPGEFTYRRCRLCRTVFQDPMVIADDLPLCYPKQYYTHIDRTDEIFWDQPADNSAARQTESQGLRRIRDKLREAVRAEVQGQPLPDIWGRLGKALAISPRMRMRAFATLVPDDLLPRTPRYPKALDVGCGAGDRMISLIELGWRVEGVEIDPAAADVARRVSGRPVFAGDFREIKLPQEEYGLVFMHHSIEHFEDPISLLPRINSLLAPQGRVVIVYPNPDALGAKIYGPDWYPWEVPRHLVFPAPHIIIKMAEKIGLEAVQLKYVSTEAALYFALSRAYRLGKDVIESPPVVNGWDRLLYVIESLLLHLRLSVGEEIRLVLQKR